MGSGIAQAAAQAGFYTLLYDLDPKMTEKASAAISSSLEMLQGRQKISAEQKEQIQQRISYSNDLQDCLADIFIEAIVENLPVKVALFNQLAEINHSEVIFASNTSSLSIGKIAEQVQHPERVIGMHFFNPATIMKLVEVVTTQACNEQTISTTLALAKAMGKTAVLCRDSPGFIVNRVARPYYIESLRLMEAGISEPAQTDRLMESCGFKMGPFKLMDLIGNDVNYAVSCSVYEQLNKPERLRPSPVQAEKVKQGKLGKKSGEGYFVYEGT